MVETETSTIKTETIVNEELDYWRMKNLSTCEFDSEVGLSAWSEWDRITDTSDN